jgi:hypothetical protein
MAGLNLGQIDHARAALREKGELSLYTIYRDQIQGLSREFSLLKSPRSIRLDRNFYRKWQALGVHSG